MNDSSAGQVETLLTLVSRSLRGELRGLSDTQAINRISAAMARAGIFVESVVDNQQITSQTLTDGTECVYVSVTLDVVYRAPDRSWLATRAIGHGTGDREAAFDRAIVDANWIALITTLRYGPAELEKVAA